MYIKTEINIKITEEERYILKKAQDILQNFEEESCADEESTLQDIYDAYLNYTDHDGNALQTAIDLLQVILTDGQGGEDNEI